MSATGDLGDRAQQVGRWVLGVPSRYRVAIGVVLVMAASTWIAGRALGPDPTTAEIERLGYGIPSLEASRWWTLVTGAVVVKSLTVSFVPSFTAVAVAIHEHRAKHWRAAVAVSAGQVLGVLIALVLVLPLRGGSSAFAHEMTDTVDFGISVGGFAALGAFTCYLSASVRRPLRAGVACYLLCQLLFAGLIFDVSHPIGFLLGCVGGVWLMRPDEFDRRPLRLPVDVGWLALGVVLGTAVGVVAAWNAGGVGGIFGWGP